ncbi:MAG: SRPBCC family protein [Acidimicrobiia bacterium]
MIREQPQFGIVIHRPVQDVYDFVMDLPKTPLWRPRMSDVAWVGEGEPGIGSRFRVTARALGYSFRFSFEVTEWEPPVWFAYRQDRGPITMHSGMQWVPENDGCRFLIGGNPQAGNFLVKLAEPLLWATLIKQNAADLVRLKEIMESGAAKNHEAR